MEIIDYSNKYDNEVKDLLIQLGEYISKIDIEGYCILTDDYKERILKDTINDINKYEGKMFLAKDSNSGKILGLVTGVINNEEIKSYDFSAPKRGRIIQLVVSKKHLRKGIATKLLNKMESYFKEVGCKAILINTLAYNESAKKLYSNNGYINRNIELIKKV